MTLFRAAEATEGAERAERRHRGRLYNLMATFNNYELQFLFCSTCGSMNSLATHAKNAAAAANDKGHLACGQKNVATKTGKEK